jgi:O-antigen/teichoic acid export membrane protein
MNDEKEFLYLGRIGKHIIWKGLSLVSGLFSVLYVVPALSQNQEIYGIYLFCFSFVIYLTYADFGFLSSAQKYLGEKYALGETAGEIRILGFTLFVLFLFLTPFIFLMLWASFNPGSLISNLSDKNSFIASRFFLILSVGVPIQVLVQRSSQMLFVVRIKEYIPLRIDILANLLKAGSVFVFFGNNKYFIIEYLIFTVFISILASVVSLCLFQRLEGIKLSGLFKAFRFDKFIYSDLKDLALSSFVLTLSWIVVFEIDLLILGNLSTPRLVALYGVAFTILNFLRMIVNIFLAPIGQRINHLTSTFDKNKIEVIIQRSLILLIPSLVVFVILFFIYSRNLILYWVGPEYNQTVLYSKVLVVSILFFPIINLANFYYTSKNDSNFLYTTSLIMFVVFVLSLLLTSYFLPIAVSIAFSKLFALLFNCIYSWWALNKNFKPDILGLKSSLIISIFCFILISINLIISNTGVLFTTSNKINLLIIGAVFFITLILLLIFMLICDTRLKKIKNIIINMI